MRVTYVKAGIIRDPEPRRLWLAAQRHVCMVSGVRAGEEFPDLQVAHIIGGAARSNEACNLLLLASRAHAVSHNVGVRATGKVAYNGVMYPPITLGQLLWVKRQACPAEWDPDRLAVLLGRPLPFLEPLDEAWLIERAMRGYRP